MRLRYEITVEDQLAFNLHFQKNSPTLRRNRFAIVLSVAVFLIASFGAMAELLHRPKFAWMGVVAAVLFAVIYPQTWRRSAKRLTSRLIQERPNQALFGRRVSEIRESGLFTCSDFVETMFFWKAIERIETLPGHTFVYLATVSAVVIPEHNVLEGDYHSFVDQLRRRWQEARGVASHDDLDHR